MKTTVKIKTVGIILLILLTTITVFVPQVLAKQEYLAPLQSVYVKGACTDCHTNPSGGKSLTAYGSEFKSQPNYKSDPSSAILAIGQPPGSTPATTDTVVVTPSATATLISTPKVTTVSTPNETSEAVVTSAAVSTPVITQTTNKMDKELDEKEEERNEKDETRESPGLGIIITIGIVSMVYILRRNKF